MILRRIARPLLAAAFVSQGAESLRRPMSAADAARPTVAGLRKLPDPIGSSVPENPDTLAKVTAATQIGGGLLLATGRLPRIASAALAATVLPANLGMHMFWAEPDAVSRARKRRDFMVDLSLLGGLIIASADTAGRPSLGWRGRRAARRLSEAVGLAGGAETLTDKIGHGLQSGASRGKELVEAAGERSAPLITSARKHGVSALENTWDRAENLAADAKTEAKRLAWR
jgi:uncharacterized membrane protein YphA (DoxX/SURF4 family)